MTAWLEGGTFHLLRSCAGEEAELEEVGSMGLALLSGARACRRCTRPAAHRQPGTPGAPKSSRRRR